MNHLYLVKKYALGLCVCFFYLQTFSQPTISSFTPASGPAGTTVTITGTNFSITPSNNIVFFGAVKAGVTAATGTSLTVTVPTGATWQPITVTTNGLTDYSKTPFTVTYPGGDAVFHSYSFASNTGHATGVDAISMAMADIDGDGKPDLATANRGSNTVSIFRNTASPGAITIDSITHLATAYPVHVTFSDLDGDGKPDMIVANGNSNAITVFRNTSSSGAISFASGAQYFTPGGRTSVYTAVNDIDGDGKPDVAVTNSGTASVSIFKNQSTTAAISLSPDNTYPLPAGPGGVCLGDVDNDGKPDMITANVSANSIWVLKNTTAGGTISFATNVTYNTGYSPQEVAIGDLDGDGYPEIVVAGNSNIVAFPNNGITGTVSFSAAVNITTTGSRGGLSINDMDGDGKPDIVNAISAANVVSVIRNTSTPGSFGFLPEITYRAIFGVTSTATGDMDGDGKPDIAALNFGINNGAVSLFRNRNNEPNIFTLQQHNGCAVAGSTVTATGSHFTGATAISFDGTAASSFTVVSDTLITAVVAAAIANTVSVTTPYGSGTFTIPAPTITSFTPTTGTPGSPISITGTYFCGTTAVTIGGAPASSFTVNSDTSITAIPATQVSGNVTVTTPHGTASLTGFYNGATITSFSPAAGKPGTTVTINGSGFGATPSQNIVFFGATKAAVTAASDSVLTVTVPTGATYQPITVTNNHLTVYTARPFNPTFAGGINITNESFESKVDFAAGSDPMGSAIGDFDDDGKPDMAVVNNSGNSVSVYRNTGSQGIVSFSAKTDYTTGTGPRAVAIGDFNGDGKPDMAVVNSLSSSVSIFKNTSTVGTISFDSRVDLPGASTPTNITISDMDGDGKPDIIVSTDSVNAVGIFRNTGNSTTLSFTGYGYRIGSGSYGVTVNDFDGDGKPDMATTNRDFNFVSIFKNSSTAGTLAFSDTLNTNTGTIPYGIATGDCTGDQAPEIAVANTISNTVSVIKNTSTAGVVSFAAKKDYTTGTRPTTVCFSDLDGNGRPDLAVSNYNAATVSVLRNESLGDSIAMAANIDFASGLQPYHVTAGDVDNDGKPDLIVVNRQSGTVSVLRNKVGDPKVAPSGSNPVSGNIIIKLTIDSTVQNYNGNPYVQRHYDIVPANDPSTATATITLYFTQQEFDNFNASPLHGLDLPAGANDATGKANLRVFQYHGFSTTSVPGSYTGGGVEINPDDNNIVWNSAAKWWEVTFDVTGFSGFFVSTAGNSFPLPLQLLSFTGNARGSIAKLQWTTSEEINTQSFELLRSIDGSAFAPIATVTAAGHSSKAVSYAYSDALGAAADYFYRLKMNDADGHFTYSSIVHINNPKLLTGLTAYPNPAKGFTIVGHPATTATAQLKLMDMTGKLVKTIPVSANAVQTRVPVQSLAAGMYKIVWSNGTKTLTQTVLVE